MVSTKTKISVSSTTYNLSGDYDPNDRYSIAITFSAFLEGISVTEALLKTFFNSPKVTYVRFLFWSSYTNYKGNLSTNITNRKKADINIIKDYINPPAGQTCNVEKAFIKLGDINYFAEQYIISTNPSLVNTNWGVDYIGNNQIQITYEDTTTDIVNLPIDFDYGSEYLYAYIKCYYDSFSDPIVYGSLIDNNNLPDTSDYTETNNIVTPVNVDLDTVTHVLREFSNGDPNIETTDTVTNTVIFNTHLITKEKTEYLGNTSDETIQNKLYHYTENLDYEITQNEDVTVEIIDHGSYTETKTTTVTTDIINNNYSYQIDTQIENLSSLASYELLIYKLGSGDPILDQLIGNAQSTVEEFYPIIPLRLYNQSIKDRSDWYEDSVKAYKKSIGGNLDKLLESIEDNPSIGDIDHAYIHFGFPLNTESNFEKEYIYTFFKEMVNFQQSNNQDYLDWLDDLYSNTQFIESYINWFKAQSNPSDPLYNTPQPAFAGNVVKPKETVLQLRTDNYINDPGPTTDNFDIRLSWSNINENFYTGLGKVGAKVGEYWISTDPPDSNTAELLLYTDTVTLFTQLVAEGIFTQDNLDLLQDNYIYIYNQIDSNNYRVLQINNLSHKNYIYGESYYIHITAVTALNDPTEEGFIIPLSKLVLDKLSLISSNEILVRAGNIIFNSFTEVKQKWYQSSLFRIAVIITLVVIIVTVTILSGGTSTGPVASISASIVAALGIAGTTAIIVSTLLTLAINLVIGMILSKLLYLILKPIIGSQYARILSVIGSVIITVGINTNFDFTAMTDLLLKSDKIISLGFAIADFAVNQFYNLETLQKETLEMKTEFEETSKLVEQYSDEFGFDESNKLINTLIEHMSLTETPTRFLERTLQSSDDIINISLNVINNFTDINFDFI